MAALHRAAPCRECPFRTDTEPGQFTEERYEALQCTVGRPGREASLGAPLFACHKTLEGKEQACAGWLAVCGAEHIGVRLAVSTGRIPGSALAPADGWPELYPDYDSMVEVMAR